MDLFRSEDNDTTEVMFSNMKRSFNKMIKQNEPVLLQDLKKHLHFDETETPTKFKKFDGNSYSTPVSNSSMSKQGNDVLEKMKQEINMKEASIITLKATITKWEKQVAKLEVDSKEAEINHDRDVAKLKATLNRELVKASEIQSKLQYLMEKEKSARDEMEELRKDSERQKVEMEKKILNIHREKLEEGDKAHQLRSKWLETETCLREEIMSLKSENNLLKKNYDGTKAQLQLRRSVQEENVNQTQQIKELLAELKEEKDRYKDISKKLSDHEDNLIITKALKSDLDLVPSMKSELEKLRLDNAQLKHNEQNTLLLEEQLRSVKKKLTDALARCEAFTELEIANEDLNARLKRWEATDSSGSRRPQSPSSLSRMVKDLENSQAMMLMKQGEVESSLNQEKLKLEQSLSENGKLSLNLSAEKSTVSQQADLIKRLKRKLLLVSKERDSYKSVLDSYESEATVNVDVENQRRIHKMEEIIQSYQQQSAENEEQINILEEQLSSAQVSYDKLQHELHVLQLSGGGNQTNKQDQDAIRQLKEQVAVLENSLMTVQEERDVLEARIDQRQIQGEYDPSKTKILHLLTNPISEAESTRKELMKKLVTENDTLRKRNEILENSGGQVEDLTIQVHEKLQQPSPTKELEAIKQELKLQETRNQRLMEIYTKTSREFREICFQLTGYKIDIPCSNQYRLTNRYCTSPNDYLWFQQNERGEIQMLETDFSNSLKELMELYLLQKNSIPLFLSQVTMDLYSKQTLM